MSEATALEQRKKYELVEVSPGRPKYPTSLAERGITTQAWRVLVDSIFPSAESTAAVVLAIDYCRARNLDVFKRCVHIVPIWSSKRKMMVETVWPGIAELRTTASRTGAYAGKDATNFGPKIVKEFAGEKMGRDGSKGKSYAATVEFPEWAEVTVYRMVGGERCAFVGPKVYWLEAYGTIANGVDVPNEMWQSRASGQLEKCAEAAALRVAFPEELGNSLAAEEISGREMKNVTPDEPSDPNAEAKAAAAAVMADLPEDPGGPEGPPEEDVAPEPAPAQKDLPVSPISAKQWGELTAAAQEEMGDEGELWLRRYVTETYKCKLERLPADKVPAVLEAIRKGQTK